MVPIKNMKMVLEDTMKEFAKSALRTIGIAYKDLKEGEGGEDHSEMNAMGDGVVELSGGLTFLGIFGIKDIIREEVPDAVNTCYKAGITVRMVTGDNLITAIAIAKNCNILPNDLPDEKLPEYTMEGPKFHQLVGGLKKVCKDCKNEICTCKTKKNDSDSDSDKNKKGKKNDKDKDTENDKEKDKKDDKMIEVIRNKDDFALIKDKLLVLARSRPEDKYLLVTALRELYAYIYIYIYIVGT